MGSTSYHGWDSVIVSFLKSAGLLQALHGFENDMLVMNPDFEKEEIPKALQDLQSDLTCLPQDDPQSESTNEKLQYVHLANGATPVSQTQLIRSISTFVAQNKARNNASNRNEFLRKRKRIELATDAASQEGSSSKPEDLPTCARTDAIPVNRDVQMKYDIAKNEGGPLRRTMKSDYMDIEEMDKQDDRKGRGGMVPHDPEVKPTVERHPGLEERFSNIESHLAVRYVPSPPASLLDRIRFIEGHIMRLERDYPPWAALHFNQPNRGWPPPPKTTPLIVPTHLTSSINQTRDETHGLSTEAAPHGPVSIKPSQIGTTQSASSRLKPKAKSSSLHRAVMDRLEVKKALAGED